MLDVQWVFKFESSDLQIGRDTREIKTQNVKCKTKAKN